MTVKHKLLVCGDCALTVEFTGDAPAAGQSAMKLSAAVEKQRVPGVSDVICAMRSVTVCFDPLATDRDKLVNMLDRTASKCRPGKIGEVTVVKIPVCYGGYLGKDLKSVAEISGLSEKEVVRRHISRDYLINMIGFLPGFPYLSGMDESISAPRLSEPRVSIPAGSVGIGGCQTGIYPMSSPGGWRIIGRTPIKPYDPERLPTVLYGAGDYIRFFAISEDEYKDISEKVCKSEYTVEKVRCVK